jgi:hypothetical protein
MATLAQRLQQAVRDNYDACDVRVPADPDDIHFRKDKDFDDYWVTVEVLVSPMDLCSNSNPFYSVWECEDFSEKGDWSDVSDWRLDELYQCEDDDDAGTNARRQAHDRAKYLRGPVTISSDGKVIQPQQRLIYAVRPGNEPPRLLPSVPAAAGDDQ